MPARAEGLLTRASPRVDGTGDIIWDVDVSFGCDSTEAAQVVDGFVPGALQTWDAGSSGSKSSVKSVGGYDLVRVEFSDQEGKRVASGHADIRYCSFTVSGDVAMLTIRLRVHGLLQDAAAKLVYKLDKIIGVEVDNQQIKMFKPDIISNEAETNISASNLEQMLGHLIIFEHGSTVISGVLTAVGEKDFSIQTMGGQELSFNTAKSNIVSNFIIKPEGDRGIVEYLKEYTDIADGNGSWDDFVQAFGELFAEGVVTANADGGWPLSDLVVARAIDILAQGENNVI
jgi:hypothetical protein